MSEPERPEEEIPPFDLPEWGTAGAPPVPGEEPPKAPDEGIVPAVPTLTLTTTDGVPGRQVRSFLGLVVGEAAQQAGGDGLEAALETARGLALERLRDRAAAVGAEAVVGVRLNVTLRKLMVLVTAVGTAVSLRPA